MIKFFVKKKRMPQKNHVEPNGAVGLFGVKSEKRLDQKFWLKMPKKASGATFSTTFLLKKCLNICKDLLAFWNCQKRPFSGQKSPIYRDLLIQCFAPKTADRSVSQRNLPVPGVRGAILIRTKLLSITSFALSIRKYRGAVKILFRVS